MGHYGAETPKPERGWTNNTNFAKLSRGKMNMKEFKSTKKTVKKTISKQTGKVSYSGTKDLKSTQIPADNLYMFLYNCFYSSHGRCWFGSLC
jgi:hypothetical protein